MAPINTSSESWSLERLLGAMEKGQASDLFISEGKAPAMRIRGDLVVFDLPATGPAEIKVLLESTLTAAQRARLEARGDLDIGFSLPGGRRFRLNLSRQQGRIGVVARALPRGALLFEDLRLPKAIEQLAELRRGLILVTGATGSGKSTTLAAIIHHINRNRPAHIVTIEDPIEFIHQDIRGRVTQREIGSDTPNFDAALRNILRESPDVIVIGEIRDYETLSVAMSAALTGHLVLATLHTLDATQTIQRILAFYPEFRRTQAALDLSLAIEGIVSQRLLPRADEKGLVVATELLVGTPAVKQLLREQRTEDLQDLMKVSPQVGMRTFNRAMIELYAEGVIRHDVGLAYSTNPDEFALAARGMETGVSTFTEMDDGRTSTLDLKALLTRAVSYGASDLHLAVGRPPMYRISGQLRALDIPPLSTADMRVLLFAILSLRQRSAYELEREIDFALQLDDGVRFRVNAYFQKGKMAAAFRAIPTSIPSAETLGLPDSVLNIADRPQGLLLVCGPTGSGKTTTLACLVDRINATRACRIITVEDPIEYAHESKMATVDQREVYSDTKSFPAALKYILRQDPDVVLIGEMRDMETVASAITAADTGHLVMATLHANDAMQAIDRVVDVFPSHQQAQARAQISSSLVGVVSQRLLRRKDGKGRIAAFEVMVGNPAIRNLVRENKMHQARSIMETGRSHGMNTMDQMINEYFHRGLISQEEALRYISNPVGLEERAGLVVG